MFFSDDLFEPKENNSIYNYLKPKYIKTKFKSLGFNGIKKFL